MIELHTYRCNSCSTRWTQVGSLPSFLANPAYMNPNCCMFKEIKLVEIEYTNSNSKVEDAIELSKYLLSE